MSEKGKAPPKKRKRSGKPNELDPHSIPAMYLAEIKDEFIDPDYDPDEELTIGENKFCVELIACRIQSHAYQRAFPKAGYSAAIRNSHHLMQRPEIVRRINNLQRDQNRRTLNSSDDVLKRVIKRAKADPRDLLDQDGDFKAPHDLHPDVAIAVAEIKCFKRKDEDGNIERSWHYKLVDQGKADELLGKNHELWTDKVKHVKGGTQAENDQRAKESQARLMRDVPKVDE